MKRKHVESKGVKNEEKEANGSKDLSTVQQSSYGQNGIIENVDVPVVVRGALTNWPSLNWGEEGWLKVLGDQEIEVALLLFTWSLIKICTIQSSHLL